MTGCQGKLLVGVQFPTSDADIVVHAPSEAARGVLEGPSQTARTAFPTATRRWGHDLDIPHRTPYRLNYHRNAHCRSGVSISESYAFCCRAAVSACHAGTALPAGGARPRQTPPEEPTRTHIRQLRRCARSCGVRDVLTCHAASTPAVHASAAGLVDRRHHGGHVRMLRSGRARR